MTFVIFEKGHQAIEITQLSKHVLRWLVIACKLEVKICNKKAFKFN